MLASRGIDPEFVSGNFQQIGESLNRMLSDDSAEMISHFIQAGRAACAEKRENAQENNSGELAQTQGLFLESILKGRRQAAVIIALEALQSGCGMIDGYTEILQESQYQLGRLWESNKITVAEEHMATTITQFVMAQIYPLIQPADKVLVRSNQFNIEFFQIFIQWIRIICFIADHLSWSLEGLAFTDGSPDKFDGHSGEADSA